LRFAGAVVFRLHRTCYVIWQEERGTVHREITGGSAAASGPLRFADGIRWRPRPDRATFEDLAHRLLASPLG
jgi:hypothetical protein